MKLLVTTALEETWGNGQDILFLGEWCKLYGRKETWESKTHETIKYNWDDREKLYSDAKYLEELYEKLLVELSEQLNKIHNVNYSKLYWRILIGIWLGFFIQILLQRWQSINNATHNSKDIETIILNQDDESLVPNDMLSFIHLCSSDLWNHYIFGKIILFRKNLNFKIIESQKYTQINNKLYRRNVLQKVKSMILFFVRTFNDYYSFFFSKDTEFFFINTYLTLFDELKLHLRFKQFPKIINSKNISKFKVEKNIREWTWIEKNSSDFEQFIKLMIPIQMPSIYLEGYTKFNKYLEKSTWPKQPKLIFTANSHIYDDYAKFWIAQKVEKGTPLVIGQHGGGPLHKMNFQTDHELAICNGYLFPGSRDASWHDKIFGVGQFFRRKWKYSSKGGGLLIELTVPRYFYSISSTVQSDDFIQYLYDQKAFMEALPIFIREQFTIRLSCSDHSWNMESRWRNDFPEVTIDKGKKPIYKIFKQSKIIVCTYAATTYNQTLAANAPTVIFWDENYNQMHDLAKPYFDMLKKAGIFHATPESAAKHISKVWDDVEIWWNSKEVQDARIFYCKKYAYIPDNLLDNIEDSLRMVIAKT